MPPADLTPIQIARQWAKEHPGATAILCVIKYTRTGGCYGSENAKRHAASRAEYLRNAHRYFEVTSGKVAKVVDVPRGATIVEIDTRPPAGRIVKHFQEMLWATFQPLPAVSDCPDCGSPRLEVRLADPIDRQGWYIKCNSCGVVPIAPATMQLTLKGKAEKAQHTVWSRLTRSTSSEGHCPTCGEKQNTRSRGLRHFVLCCGRIARVR